MGDKVRGSGLAHGACRPLIAYERGVVDSTGSAGSEGAAGGGAFRHPERRKTSYVKNGLSENMRTESKDLSAAEIWN